MGQVEPEARLSMMAFKRGSYSAGSYVAAKMSGLQG